MNEISTLSKINNPNIIKFIEMLVTKHNYYFVYEYCNGSSLEDKLKLQHMFLFFFLQNNNI